MKAQHVVTGADRDRAYGSILVCILLVILGVFVAADLEVWIGLIVIGMGVLCGIGGRARLRGEV